MIDVLLVFALLALLVRPVGEYVAHVMQGNVRWLSRVESGVYRLLGVNPQEEMHWTRYAFSIVLLSFISFVALYAVLLFQHLLPLNPRQMPGVAPDLAFNIAISFVTNTNWQSYAGETTLSHFAQSAGLGVQNFLSAACGMAVACAVARGFTRKSAAGIGNAWVDITRITLYVLLPMSLLFACVLLTQGVPQTYDAGSGPVASQVAIKMLGSNGGGFFDANAAHPWENPTPFSNVLQLVSILLLPVAILYAFGALVGDRRQGVALIAAAALIFLPLFALAAWQEAGTIIHLPAGVASEAGNLEGKEWRFGTLPSALWATATTATSNGSTNANLDSFMPLSSMASMVLMKISEVAPGGVGSGAYSMLLFVIITVFLGGLMVGRTPEYLGKKLGPFEIKMASLAMLVPCMLTLVGTALAVMMEAGRTGVLNQGPQGFSEVLYAFTSAANNNGSALGGLSSNTVFYNITLSVVMWLGRFFVMIPVLAIAGSLAARNIVPTSAGTLPTHQLMFVLLLVSVIVLVGVLSYAPALMLGPVAEHLLLFGGAP